VTITAPTSGAEEQGAPGPRRVPGGWRAHRIARGLELRRDLIVDPLAGATVLVALARPGNPLSTALLGLAAFAAGAAVARRVAAQAALLPLMRHVQPLIGPALGVLALAVLELLTGRPHAGMLDLLAAFGSAACLDRSVAALVGAPPPGSLRAAYIGSAFSAARLSRALEAGGSSQYRRVGRVQAAEDTDDAPGSQAAAPPDLGPLEDLAAIVVDERVDLLVLGAEAPRSAVFGQMVESCLELPVRLVDLSALFEEVFGHVPTAEIDPTWFECLAGAHGRAATGAVKRTLDFAVAAVVLVLLAPLLLALVLLVRRDGGPGLFVQVRIGERGRPFRVYKLRTMRVGTGRTAQWAEREDPRITRIGRFLRASHLDELPQLINVLRGEMSLVGPRPEQPEFVDRLERTLPFYQRRHLIRPGITGWAQIRCGYAGSDVGSAWKLCHDLYYAKHRSLGLDLLILCETVSTLLFEREPVLHPESFAYVLREPPR
jgi:exopolysaccharide biosynthesis polyprenyl glycosylphosphotransferase